MTYNLDMLREMSGGDESFVTMMVQMFIDSSPEIMTEMEAALAEERWKDLGGLAHKIKPTIDTMGIATLKELIREIEKDGKAAANLALLPDKVTKLNSTINTVIQQMKHDFKM